MLESYNIINCNRCGHKCHCDNLVCSHLLGVGMSDKYTQCGCGVCECTSNRSNSPGD
jgi:hypothetical protein